jgi:hypothetical protein
LLRAKDYPCISIIVSTSRTDTRGNRQALQRAATKARGLLHTTPCTVEQRTQLDQKINDTVNETPIMVLDGLGIYISPQDTVTQVFPFPVKTKVVVNNNFELRDLFYLKQLLETYWVLKIAEHTIQLFKGQLLELEHVSDDHFPLPYQEYFVYQPTGVENAQEQARGRQKEFSAIQWKALYRDVAVYLRESLHIQDRDILLAGKQATLNLFLTACPGKNEYLGMIHGAYPDKNLLSLGQKAWEAFFRGKIKERELSIDQLIASHRSELVAGLESAWRIARQGQGHTLLVEKDFYHKAYFQPDTHMISMAHHAHTHGLIPDAVDDLIEMVHENSGRILFTENDRLKPWGRLVLIPQNARLA